MFIDGFTVFTMGTAWIGTLSKTLGQLALFRDSGHLRMHILTEWLKHVIYKAQGTHTMHTQ
jgi:hypothetical protein